MQGLKDKIGLKALPPGQRRVPAYASDIQQEFHRSPDPFFASENDAAFVANSRRALALFIDYFNAIDPDAPSGAALKQTMDAMRRAYGGGAEPEYRRIEINFRGKQMRAWIARNYGREAMARHGLPEAVALEVYPDEPYALGGENEGLRVPLPGIGWDQWPVFASGGAHRYPVLEEDTIRQFYARLAEELARFADHLIAIDAAAPVARRARIGEALDTVVDFARLAASFRQYRNGNWGLYGPVVNEMVRRLGFNIEFPGYLDLIMQGATEESIKRFFPVALAHQLPFFSEDGENPVVLNGANVQNQPAAALAIACWRSLKSPSMRAAG